MRSLLSGLFHIQKLHETVAVFLSHKVTAADVSSRGFILSHHGDSRRFIKKAQKKQKKKCLS